MARGRRLKLVPRNFSLMLPALACRSASAALTHQPLMVGRKFGMTARGHNDSDRCLPLCLPGRQPPGWVGMSAKGI
ncbi:hypothetical protein FIBSPDRAFT_449161 [Athelia psychrophila]|uniref:Secreted protein n=1 Tax=Athelia psychrophila TaxID=1759441 RepID=A0A167UEP5_9AGAM|nr:hypothetical protein FIBSPDRAFT_449161 [Fibularhizoctonia sp. CBS 109695]